MLKLKPVLDKSKNSVDRTELSKEYYPEFYMTEISSRLNTCCSTNCIKGRTIYLRVEII